MSTNRLKEGREENCVRALAKYEKHDLKLHFWEVAGKVGVTSENGGSDATSRIHHWNREWSMFHSYRKLCNIFRWQCVSAYYEQKKLTRSNHFSIQVSQIALQCTCLECDYWSKPQVNILERKLFVFFSTIWIVNHSPVHIQSTPSLNFGRGHR